jgi:hypothetical protein
MRTTYTDFATNYIAKNGEKANQTVLGRPNLQLKLESDLNYEYIQAILGNINAWNSSTIYSAGQIVKYNNKVYISQQDNNLNQAPDASNSNYWTYSDSFTLGCYVGGGNNGANLLMTIGNLHNPLLDLPLKNSLAMRSGVGSATFTRASTATYIDMYGILKKANVNEPRFEKEGYLNEGSSTNLLTYSNQFNSDGGWTLSNATTKQNTIGPDGVDNSAWYLDETTGAGDSIVYKAGFSLTANTIYTASFFAKKAEDSEVYCWYEPAFFKDGIKRFVKYNFDTKVLTDVNNNLQGKNVVELANDWVRISMTFLVDNSATASANVIGSLSDTDNTGSGVYIYGAQLEALSFATSYIPTTNSTVTRAVDFLNIDRAGNIPNVEANGSISVVCDIDIFGETGNNQWVWALYSSYNDSIGMLFQTLSSGYSSANSKIGGESVTFGSVSSKTTYRIAQVVSNAGHYAYKNGIQTDFKADNDSRITSTCNSSVSTVRIGSYTPTNADSSYVFHGHISNFRVYDRALTAYEVSFA